MPVLKIIFSTILFTLIIFSVKKISSYTDILQNLQRASPCNYIYKHKYYTPPVFKANSFFTFLHSLL